MIGGVTLGNDGFYHDEGGRPFVRVSTVLKEFGFIDDRFFDEDSRIRGSAVHLAVKFRLKGTLDETSIDPQIAPRVAGFDQFIASTGFSAIHFETAVCDPYYRFAGTLDVYGSNRRGELMLLDIKTGPMQQAARLQMGAYAFCIPTFPVGATKIKRYALELPERGGYNLVPVVDQNEGPIFAGLAAAWWYKWNTGQIKRKKAA